MYRVTFSRPGAALPYEIAYWRGAGFHALAELVPLGGTLEVLPGNLSGSGHLTLNRVPDRGGQRLRPGDWVRVYLGDAAAAVYLGEVASAPWEEGQGDVQLTPLKDRVAKAAWRGDLAPDGKTVLPFRAKFRPYLQGVLARAVLPPGVTVGEIPEVNATLQALTLFEQVGDTLAAALPALSGGTWGVNAAAQVKVHQLTDALTHRFTREVSDRPAAKVGDYANCVRFEYARPDATRAFFELRLPLEIALFGEAWAEETLPASVTTTQTNPYAGTLQGVQLTLGTTQAPGWTTPQYLNQPATSPVWAGKLADGVNTSLAWGTARQLRQLGEEAVTVLVSSGITTPYITRPLPGLALETVKGGVVSSVYVSPNDDRYPGWVALASNSGTFTLRYTAASVTAFRNATGRLPEGFDIRFSGENVQVELTAAPTADPVRTVRLTAPVALVPGTASYPRYAPTITPLTVQPGASMTFPISYQWRSGDTVNTNAAVTGVTAVLNTTPATMQPLTRLVDDPDTGRRRWALPADFQLSGLQLAGDPAQIGWIGINLTDEAGLAAYAYGLLRWRTDVVRSWVGRYPDLRPLEVSGMARFDTPQGDTDLQVTRGVYDLTSLRSSIEAGTPQALDDAEALGNAFLSVERTLRKPGGTNG
ncbi:hypothetical protein DEIPH_ctg013orf0045 [Deinococcus phoenicis]|uniref:Uncharacterized protein n=1 Tax=Deinococcus phoenicis TaxID=1476583 RepID=A0A016QSQ1_9DEIO|nr:hypothetical protein [Deinococcus phoenicis]EYB68937.1 hypothetical protein DEIPH_ctg013orf0045 [Deinococcus phoenicis]